MLPGLKRLQRGDSSLVRVLKKWNAGLLAYAVLIGFTPIILAALASRSFKPELMRPVLAP